MPLTTAQAVFAETGVTRVDIGLSPGADRDTVSAALESRLTAQPYVLSSPQDLAAALRASTADFQATTALIAAIALFAGAFLIFNTLSMTVVGADPRSRPAAGRRARAAARSCRSCSSRRSSSASSARCSGSSSAPLLAAGIVAWVRTVGVGHPRRARRCRSTPRLALIVGIGVTLAAALEPARRAGRISAGRGAQGRGSTADRARRARLRWLVVVFAVVGARRPARLAAWRRRARASSGRSSSTASCSSRRCSCRSSCRRSPGSPASPFALLVSALEERLARSSRRPRPEPDRADPRRPDDRAGDDRRARRGRQHARAAAGALDRRRRAGRRCPHLDPPDRAPTRVAEDLAAASRASSGSARSPPSTSRSTAYATDGAAVVGADLAADGRLTLHRRRPRCGPRRPRRRGAVIVPAALAERVRPLASTMTLDGRRPTTARSCALRVVGIAERTLPGRDRRGDARRLERRDVRLGVAGADAFAVRFAPGAPASARDALERGAALAALDVVRSTGSRAPSSDALGRIFGLFDALALVAVLDRRARHRQHADDERHRARPRDRHPARGRDDPRPGLALGRRRGRLLGLAGALLASPLGLAGRGIDGRPGGRPARSSRAGSRGRSSAWRSCSASPSRCWRRPIRPASRAACLDRPGRPVRVTPC